MIARRGVGFLLGLAAAGAGFGASEVRWEETPTHRIKIKLVDGREVGRWEFLKKPGQRPAASPEEAAPRAPRAAAPRGPPAWAKGLPPADIPIYEALARAYAISPAQARRDASPVLVEAERRRQRERRQRSRVVVPRMGVVRRRGAPGSPGWGRMGGAARASAPAEGGERAPAAPPSPPPPAKTPADLLLEQLEEASQAKDWADYDRVATQLRVVLPTSGDPRWDDPSTVRWLLTQWKAQLRQGKPREARQTLEQARERAASILAQGGHPPRVTASLKQMKAQLDAQLR